ncbi:hypothetical protein [Sellimonas intestinalis]|uniref:hypothetical protein n=1 Tax=Lachnospiraceae TaxID=186803 RepID=UPI003992656F
MQHIKYIYEAAELRERCKEALKKLDTDTEYSMEDVIEYYNIGHLIEEKDKINNSIFDCEEEKLKEYAKKIKQVTGKFMYSIDDSNCKEIYDQLDIGWREDFWKLFAEFKVYSHVGEKAFEDILLNAKIAIYDILKYRYIVETYTRIIKKWLLEYWDSAEILLDKYVIGKTIKEINLPELDRKDIDDIFMHYISSPYAHINRLEIIQNIKNTKQFTVSDKIKANAVKRRKELIEQIEKENRGIRVDTQICVSFRDDIQRQPEDNLPNCEYYIYDRKWLSENQDEATLLNNFIYLLEFFDFGMRPTFLSKEWECSSLERVFKLKTENDYLVSGAYNYKIGLTVTQLKAYYLELQRLGKPLEAIIEWFFREYLKQEFHVENFVVTMPSENSSYLEKCRLLLPELESILKQYKLYVEERQIDRDLLEITSGSVDISKMPSLVENKYLYGKGEEFQRVKFDFFSDQSMLHWVKRINKNYRNFFNLILNEKICKEDYGSYVTEELNWLGKNKWIYYDEEGYIRFYNIQQIVLFADLVRNDFINICSFKKYEKEQYDKIIDEFIKKDMMRYGNGLFSEPEQDWVSFIFNKSRFNNSMDIRNRYMHGTQANSYDEPRHMENYFYILLVCIFYIIKINDDLCAFFDEKG